MTINEKKKQIQKTYNSISTWEGAENDRFSCLKSSYMARNREKMTLLKVVKEMQKNMERRDTKQISNIERIMGKYAIICCCMVELIWFDFFFMEIIGSHIHWISWKLTESLCQIFQYYSFQMFLGFNSLIYLLFIRTPGAFVYFVWSVLLFVRLRISPWTQYYSCYFIVWLWLTTDNSEYK